MYKCTIFFFSIPHCLFVAGTVTTATIDVAVQESLWYVVLEFFGEISRSGITRSHGRWLFFRTSIPISIESALVYIPTHSGRYTLIHILTRIFYFLTYWYSYWCEIESQCNFNLNFYDKKVGLFTCAYWTTLCFIIWALPALLAIYWLVWILFQTKKLLF